MEGQIDEEAEVMVPNRFSVETLQVGHWKRMSLHPHDLVCHYDTQRRVMIWRIRDGHQQFKMEFSFDTILQINLQPLLERLGWARMEISVAQPESIAFYMEDSPDHWTQCRDFTQDRQATAAPVHHLDGPALALRAEVQRLAQEDAHIQALLMQNPSIDPRFLNVDPTSSGGGSSNASGPHMSQQQQQQQQHAMMPPPSSESSMLSLLREEENDDSQDLLLFKGMDE